MKVLILGDLMYSFQADNNDFVGIVNHLNMQLYARNKKRYVSRVSFPQLTIFWYYFF